MKKLVLQAVMMLGFAATAMAAGATESGGSGLLVALFLGFVGVIVVFQLIPSLVVFFSVIREIFAPRKSRAPQVVKQEEVE